MASSGVYFNIVTEVVLVVVILWTVFGPDGVASNAAILQLYAEPIQAQNFISTAISIASVSPGEFTAVYKGQGNSLKLRFTKAGGKEFAQVVPIFDVKIDYKPAQPMQLFLGECSLAPAPPSELSIPKGPGHEIRIVKIPGESCKVSVEAD